MDCLSVLLTLSFKRCKKEVCEGSSLADHKAVPYAMFPSLELRHCEVRRRRTGERDCIAYRETVVREHGSVHGIVIGGSGVLVGQGVLIVRVAPAIVTHDSTPVKVLLKLAN